MREIDKTGFARLPLRVHSFLAGVSLHTLQRVELPGGRTRMMLPEINAVLGFSSAEGIEERTVFGNKLKSYPRR